MDYNYERFRTSNYEYEKFPGPKAGEIMQDFTLHSLDGKEVKLSDYRGKWVVIELPGIIWGHLKVDVARLFGKNPS